MDMLPALREALKRYGQSLTQPRQKIFTALQYQEPLTMHELVARCAGVDRASVYRTVALFEQLGIVQRLQTGWKYKLELTEPFHTHHHHATCLQCGRSFVVPIDEAVEKHLQTAAGRISFQLAHHQIELQGTCTDCQKLLEDYNEAI